MVYWIFMSNDFKNEGIIKMKLKRLLAIVLTLVIGMISDLFNSIKKGLKLWKKTM